MLPILEVLNYHPEGFRIDLELSTCQKWRQIKCFQVGVFRCDFFFPVDFLSLFPALNLYPFCPKKEITADK